MSAPFLNDYVKHITSALPSQEQRDSITELEEKAVLNKVALDTLEAVINERKRDAHAIAVNLADKKADLRNGLLKALETVGYVPVAKKEHPFTVWGGEVYAVLAMAGRWDVVHGEIEKALRSVTCVVYGAANTLAMGNAIRICHHGDSARIIDLLHEKWPNWEIFAK